MKRTPLRRFTFVDSIVVTIAICSAARPAEPGKLEIPATGRLAFHSYTAYDTTPSGGRPLDGRIHVYEFNTRQRLTISAIDTQVQHAMNPNFSADGTRLTFMGLPRRTGYGADWPEALDVFVYDFRTHRLTNVSKRAHLGQSVDEDPVFGPDGDSVIFKRNRADLWQIDLASFKASAITIDGKRNEESGPKVSPDGHWIAYWVGGGAAADVYRRPFGIGATQLLAGQPGIQEMYPTWLGDRRLAYTRWSDPEHRDDEVFIVDLVTGQHRAAAFNRTGDANDSDPFHVADNLIGFSSDRRGGYGGWDIYLGDPASGRVHWLGQASTPQHDLGGAYTRFMPKEHTD